MWAGKLPKVDHDDFMRLTQNSLPLKACTGSKSLAEVLSFGGLPLYQVVSHLVEIPVAFKDICAELELHVLSRYFCTTGGSMYLLKDGTGITKDSINTKCLLEISELIGDPQLFKDLKVFYQFLHIKYNSNVRIPPLTESLIQSHAAGKWPTFDSNSIRNPAFKKFFSEHAAKTVVKYTKDGTGLKKSVEIKNPPVVSSASTSSSTVFGVRPISPVDADDSMGHRLKNSPPSNKKINYLAPGK